MQISEQGIRKICSSAIYKRGIEYYNLGRVHMKKRNQDGFTAVVDGEQLYSVSVKLRGDGDIADSICTCPYYETMGSACKHIVAACEQRRRELLGEISGNDLNDSISENFISEFCRTDGEKTLLPIKFELCIRRGGKNMSYAVRLNISGRTLESPEELLECFAYGRPIMISRKINYHPSEYTFGEPEERILTLLAESFESRAAGSNAYIKCMGEVPVGKDTVKRLLYMLSAVDYKIVLNGMDLGRVLIAEEDPEVLIDISAVFGEITMFVANYGICILPDASAFYYEGSIFLTSEEWSRSFLPIYRALCADSRTQLAFKGQNALAFATYVLPKLKDKPGVVTDGLDEYIISEKPEFTVYIDYSGKNVRAKIKASYGKVSFFLPDNEKSSEWIVVRDAQEEEKLMSYFVGFAYSGGYYVADDDDVVYEFITERVPALSQRYTVIKSELFNDVKIMQNVNISANVSYSQSVHLLDAQPHTDLSAEEIAGILSAVRLKNRFYRNVSGDFYDISAITEKMLFFEGIFGDKFERKSLPEYNMLYLCAASGEDITCSKELEDYVEKTRKSKAHIPDELTVTLRGYQEDGINWMKQLTSFGFGGILADDMGLGKTVQALAFIKGENPEKPSLIVTPSSLTYNWLHEILKFLPNSRAIIIDGSAPEREKKLENISEYEFVIVSYALLRRDIKVYSDFEFEYCILDEAQAIKNPQTMSARAVKKIHAKGKFALTGTPIENSLKELWSIFDFLMPGYLKNYESFRKSYEMPLVKDGNDKVLSELREKIKPFILRRMKKDVLSELPDKIEDIVYAKMTDEQEKMYVSYRMIAKDKALAAMCEDGRANIEVLTLILRLRQISCHPSLFDSAYKAQSGKLILLYEMLDTAVLSGHRVLVFSQFTSMLSIIASGLREKSIKYFYIDGSTPPQKRLEFADRFNGGECEVFLISLKAGGTGLNLTGADTVIHYDPWWNPAVTDQASDRAYRIGQDKNVHVIRLASENTIEAKIIELQEKKRSLAEDVVNVNNSTLSSLSNEEIISLFD